MSVDVSGLKEMIAEYGAEKMQCLAEGFAEQARQAAPVDTGELAASIEVTGVSVGGSSASATVVAGTDHAIYAEHGRGSEHGLLAFQVGGELVVVTEVAPMPGSHFWADTVASWPEIVTGCA
jgi:Bacteriophage HK97-gp10, putative tail-component